MLKSGEKNGRQYIGGNGDEYGNKSDEYGNGEKNTEENLYNQQDVDLEQPGEWKVLKTIPNV